MSYEAISLEINDGVALVTLERPDTRNVISDEPMLSELIDVCDRLNGDRAAHVAILTGRGPAFSAGGNIRQMADRTGMFAGATHEIADGYRTGVQRLIRTVVGLELPIIAAVNGHAIGAGFDLTLACDLRLSASTARFGETFVNLGIVPGDGGSWLLPRAVGMQRAAELAFTGRVFDAEEALSLGVVLSVHEPDELLPAAFDLARTIAAKPPVAMRYTKQLLRRSESPLDEVLETTAGIQAMLHGTQDHADALAEMLAEQAARSKRRAQASGPDR